ncbi:MvdC/MvdD family ATP grasp protein [Streptomyces sp. NPDC059575]|uniref:MvdC/MvdD family ATP grasp protein n=1 Tax=Streptomyces sp. NPDC059575 TaxID=3346872 RepID=UPI0036D06311
MSAPVLIVAADDDWPTDRVVTELTGRGVEVFRMDTADFPQQLVLAARIDQSTGWTGELSSEHRTVDLSRSARSTTAPPGRSGFRKACLVRRRGSPPPRHGPALAGSCRHWSAAG